MTIFFCFSIILGTIFLSFSTTFFNLISGASVAAKDFNFGRLSIKRSNSMMLDGEPTTIIVLEPLSSSTISRLLNFGSSFMILLKTLNEIFSFKSILLISLAIGSVSIGTDTF